MSAFVCLQPYKQVAWAQFCCRKYAHASEEYSSRCNRFKLLVHKLQNET